MRSTGPGAADHIAGMSDLTLVSAWARTRDALMAAGVDSPVLDARALVEAAVGVRRLDILTDPHRKVSEAATARLDAFVARRAAREPLAYILGRQGFWTLDLEVDPAVLVPRADTEAVVLIGRELLAGAAAPRILDLGAGSGAILLALLAERADASGLGIDRSGPAVELARRNAAQAGLADRAAFQLGDWAHGIAEAFDLLVSNPPYVRTGDIDGLAPEVARYEPRAALDGGPDGLDAFRALAPQVRDRLKPGGGFALEVGIGQAGAAAGLLAAAGLAVLGVRPDLSGIDRVVYGRRPE